AVQVIGAIREVMDQLQGDLPGGMELVWVTDDGTFTKSMVDSAWINVLQGILLTAFVLFLFLYNFRSTLVIGMTMPITIIIGLFFMQAAGFTLNVSTLLSLGMSVGILVTNSIVVLEAIVKHLEEGKSPREAARRGANESFVAVLASAGTNVVVLLPVSIMPGMIGLFMKPFALTMIIVTLVSLFVSFTLTPMLCALLLKPKKKNSHSPLAYMEWGWNSVFDRLIASYRWLLKFTDRYRIAAVVLLLLVVLIFGHSLKTGSMLGFSMGSDPDRGEIFVKLEFSTTNSLARTEEGVTAIEERLRSLPHLRHMLTTIGKVEGIFGQTSEGVYLAQTLLRFNERIDRQETINDLVELVREKVADSPGVLCVVTVPDFAGGQGSDIEFEIAGSDLDTLDQLVLKAQGVANGIPGFLEPDTTVRSGKSELRIKPNRVVLADLDFPAATLGMILRGNIEGITAGTFKRDARNYDIVVKFAEEQGKDQVRDFLFPGVPGRPVSLANIGTIEESMAPIQIVRKDKNRVAKLFANLDPSLALGMAVEKLSAEFEEQVPLPPGYTYHFGGMYEMMSEGVAALMEAGLIAILLVVLLLAAILESFKQPIIILVTLPLALIGVFYSLYLGGYSIGIFALMSIVMLIGIVVNNAILIMDQFNVHVAAGMPRHAAMVNAACERFRPIVMITLAAVLGMLPLAFGRGIGAELRNDTGLASAGGILVSGILTLLVMPIL
ncbi:MAG: efflux RND transporter permease subunit, partial [Candidatus Hydrogenedentes bacterium]|nr:efflux RND transporter permease subunit [Candidatus Hydrogenedentota bacterium]